MNTNEVNRSDRYALQTAGLTPELRAFLDNKNAKTIDLPIQAGFETTGIPEWTQNYAMTTFTKAQIRAGLTVAFNNCVEYGPQAASDMPTKPRGVGFLNGLDRKYTSKPRKGDPYTVDMWLHCAANTRRANKRAAYKAELQAAVDSGAAYTAEGVVDGDGVLRTYVNQQKAANAWARKKYGDSWWQTDKAARQAEGMKHTASL